MTSVRSIRRVRVASRHFEHAQKFVAEMQPHYAFPIEPLKTIEAAVRGADLIATVTSSADPIIQRDWIAPGAHLNVVGANLTHAKSTRPRWQLPVSLSIVVNRR
jgi:ornithine cyclodeaminase